MILPIALLIIGILVLGAGLFYRVKEAGDAESRKLYSIVSLIGLIVAVIGGGMLVF